MFQTVSSLRLLCGKAIRAIAFEKGLRASGTSSQLDKQLADHSYAPSSGDAPSPANYPDLQ